MAEGGLLRWKVQKVDMRGPVADYSGLSQPLPLPPPGMVWKRNEETREWSLGKESDEEEKLVYGNEEGKEVTREEREADNNDSPIIGDVISDKVNKLAMDLGSLSCGKSEGGDEWEMVSEKSSVTSFGVVVSRNGSIRSAASLGTGNTSGNLVHPIKLQRSTSSSTLDSNDGLSAGCLSMGIPGVDYVEHVVLSTDTLQGLCLAYKISATRLRQANQFSGSTLLLAPKKLIIPLSYKALKSGQIRMQDRDSREFKVQAFQAELSSLRSSEAKAYLELADWDLAEAIRSARDDGEWEKEERRRDASGPRHKQPGDIDVRVTLQVREGVPVGATVRASGGGICEVKTIPADDRSVASSGTSRSLVEVPPPVHTGVPAEVSKNITANDIYKAPPQLDGHGVEMQDLVPSVGKESSRSIV